MFYLNRTSSESNFTTAELFENINKIVKLLNYNPVGCQTAILSFLARATNNLLPGIYTIPRYSYFTINGVVYSFNKDVTFSKTSPDAEQLVDLQENNLLYQGSYSEYPIFTATGSPFEVLTLTVVSNGGSNALIDHFNIDVYVKDNTVSSPKWEKWNAVQSLFLEKSNSKSYEIRLNENQRYEIKFGNNVTGKGLNAGDEVAIYYLFSNGPSGEVGPGLLDNNSLFFYSTPQFNAMKADIIPSNLNLISDDQSSEIIFSNIDASTKFQDIESVESIKQNATNTFRSQYRLITTQDFINYISKNYSNIISSVQAVNNWDYISGHLKYYFDLGITKPNLESRVLFNQVKFADSCNFNNIYIYAVPKLEKLTSITTRANYLNSAQKQIVLNDIQQVKLATAEIIVNDPVYMAVDLGIALPGELLSPSTADTTYLEITREVTAKRNPEAIRDQVNQIFKNYFSTLKDNLGVLISLTDITNQIKALEGVKDIKTVRTINGASIDVPGVSLLLYNPIYSETDIQIVTQDLQLPYFKFPFLHNPLDFINKIKVVTPSIQTLQREF